MIGRREKVNEEYLYTWVCTNCQIAIPRRILDIIEKWPYSDAEGLLEYVHEIWAYADSGYWRQKGRRYWISTAGWSGNEDIMGALHKNTMFWMMCWQSSKRGGHFVFEILKEVKD